MKVAVIGMGLIGGSLYKAALEAGYSCHGFDRQDAPELGDCDVVLLALPQEALPGWAAEYGKSIRPGAIVVDTCGMKAAICKELGRLLPKDCVFVGGHPMAGKEKSGFAYSEAGLFKGASMILTPSGDTPHSTLEFLEVFFGRLGFGKVLCTTPERHDAMIAYTSHLGHVIAAAYTQLPQSSEAGPYAAGSYANMTRIASMQPQVWEKLFSTNKDNLLPVLDGFIERMQAFRDMLANGETSSMQEFIAAGAASKAKDGFNHNASKQTVSNEGFGNYLKLDVFGASHAPGIGMSLRNFPGGVPLDLQELQAFLERRAPGRDKLSTQRKEADLPEFISGVDNGLTTGSTIVAQIRNSDTRPQDYGQERTVPRPGHADYPQWVQMGRIPTGGGANSGRMTAPMCIAGGICLQWLAKRNVQIQGRLVEVAGKSDGFEQSILDAKAAGDSVGGIIEVTATGLPAGLGGAMFQGLEGSLASALFGIPGVKGVEFGAGFASASMRGSQNNDAFVSTPEGIATRGNNHGGLLGGMTTGMPLVVRLAMKPTPSIFMEQDSVDLATGQPAKIQVQGRHDPCIARRAIPVAEALVAFTLADAMLAAEAQTPRICLTLTNATLQQDYADLAASRPFVDMAELRVDCLEKAELDNAHLFPQKTKLPVILTIRRSADGGAWTSDDTQRIGLFQRLLSEAPVPFAFVDFEGDFRIPQLEELARSRSTRIIRSQHSFDGPIKNVVAQCQALKGTSDDIPKLAFATPHCSDLTQLFRETADFTGFPHILCAMGAMGGASRILASRTHSMLTFTSPAHSIANMSAIGHFTPETLVRTYRFRSLTARTELYAVTGWPLGHTASPELNNSAFFAEAKDAVMVPIQAETAAEAIECAQVLAVRGMAVTIPHKENIMQFMSVIDETAQSIGAVNTVVRGPMGWHGYNTDAAGFTAALLDFLQVDSIAGRKVAILGAGGASRAVAYAIYKQGADACIFNKTLEKAQALAAKYGFKSAPLSAESLPLLQEYAGIIIQATSVGLKASSPADDPIPFYQFKGSETLYDLVYVPDVTPVMQRAQKAGCRVHSGMTMLIEQAKEQRRLYARF
ncbi:MAG: chorismate synthase [Victivallales bacterium]|nr:chorismate synthase [Victivallales bacterium]